MADLATELEAFVRYLSLDVGKFDLYKLEPDAFLAEARLSPAALAALTQLGVPGVSRQVAQLFKERSADADTWEPQTYGRQASAPGFGGRPSAGA